MKCDILVHLPSGVAFTGIAGEDKFVGSPAFWSEEKKSIDVTYWKYVEVTMASDSLIMTWQKGKMLEQRKIPYAAMTSIDLSKKQEGTRGPSLAPLGLIGVGVAHSMGFLDPAFVQTLLIKTNEDDYELFVSHAADWAERLKSFMTKGVVL